MDKEEDKEEVKLRKKMGKESAVSETKESQVFMSSLTSSRCPREKILQAATGKRFWFVAETLSSIFTHSGAATARRCHPLGRNRSSWTAPRQSQWQCRRTRSRASPLTLTSGDYLGQYICDDLTFSTRIFEWSQEKVRATRKPGTWTTSQSVSISISLPPVCCVTTRTSMASQSSNIS